MPASQFGPRPLVGINAFSNALGACAMQDLEEKLERLFQTAWSLRPSSARNQIFGELEQFRLQIDALRKRTALPERKDASG